MLPEVSIKTSVDRLGNNEFTGSRMEEILDRLKTELSSALTSHYQKLTSGVPDVYGYALYSNDDISSLGPVANRESAIEVGPDNKMYNYYRYLAVEWSEWDDFGLFDDVNKIVAEIHADDVIEFSDKREAVLRVCLKVMCDLEAGGLFGPQTDERFVVICLADSDDDIMMKSAELLNSPSTFAAYSGEF